MRLIRSSPGEFVFHLGQRDKVLLLEVLKLYPRIPAAGQPLTKSPDLPDHEANQRLLAEALAEQRAENKNHLSAFLADPRRFADRPTGCRLALSRADLEWLLQILNDVRVGSWIMLGSPDEKPAKLNPITAQHFWAMEMAGAFQIKLLEALGET